MGKFTAGCMWVLQRVFGLSSSYLICNPLEKYGKYLLAEIIIGGNMGKYDGRMQGSSRFIRSLLQTKRNFLQIRYFPGEVLWSFPWRIKYFYWKNKYGWNKED
jgi:hypothetical protein